MNVKTGIMFLTVVFNAMSLYAQINLGASFQAGFGGEVETESQGSYSLFNQTITTENKLEDDLETTTGFNLFFESIIYRNSPYTVFLGGETRFLWFESESGDESMLFEINPSLKIAFSTATPVMPFLRFAPGFTMMFPEDTDFETAYGFNIAGFAGAAISLSHNFSFFSEIGAIAHRAYGKFGVEQDILDDAEYQSKATQFHLHIGAMYSL
jgi:hypothetical protein